MYNNTEKALEMIFKKEYNMKNPVSTLRDFIPKHQLLIFEKGETFICQKDPVKYLYVLLKGRGAVLNHITWNNDNVVDYVESIDILGLIEFLNNVDAYTAYVMAETRCIIYRVPVAVFNQIIQKNAFICYHALLVLGRVTEANMNRAETFSLFHPKDQLGHFLFLQAQHKIPYICTLTRRELAESLHLNLRTLYRYLDAMENQELLTTRGGKIVIEKKHLDKLGERYGDVIL